MKKKRYGRPVLAGIVLMLALTGCRFFGDTGAVRVEPMKSEDFSAEELQAAEECVKRYFFWHYKDCRLMTLAYDQERSRAEGASYENNYPEEGVTADHVIVLLGSYRTGAHPGAALTENSEYPCQGLMVRDGPAGKWKVVPGMCGWG